MKIMAIDYGDARTGFAISDRSEFLASPIGNCIYNSLSCLSPDVCFVEDIVCCDGSGALVPHSHRQVGTLFQKLGKRPALLCSWAFRAVHVYRQTYYYLTCTVFSRRLSRLICKPFGVSLRNYFTFLSKWYAESSSTLRFLQFNSQNPALGLVLQTVL